MSEYEIRYEDNWQGGERAVIYQGSKSYEIDDFINKQASEITALQEANAALRDELETAKEALGEQSKALAEARGFVRDLANKVIVTEGLAAHLIVLDAAMLFNVYRETAKDLVVSWDEAAVADVTPEKPKPPITKLYGVPMLVKRLVTRNHEAMAILRMDDDEIVAFPKIWAQYKSAIYDAIEARQDITILGELDLSMDKPQYIMQGIEGVSPAPLPTGEESEGE